jgi:hypothetical protein
LPCADEGAERRIIHRLVDVEIVEHHHRGLAAELHGLMRERFGGRTSGDAAGFGAAGQDQLVDVTMLGQ